MGHIRSTTCSEAAALGMDFIEHSFGFCDEVRLPNGDITRDPDAPPASRLIRRSAVPFALEYPGRAAHREATEASRCSSQPPATRMAEPVLFRRHAAILDAPCPGSHRIGVPLQSRARNRGRRDLRNIRRGVVLDAHEPRRTVRQQTARPRRTRPAVELCVANGGHGRLGSIARLGGSRLYNCGCRHRFAPEARLLAKKGNCLPAEHGEIVTVMNQVIARRWRGARVAVGVAPHCARNCVTNACSLSASTAKGANASATATAV